MAVTSHYELRYTRQHFTPKDSKKPDVAVLNAIIEDLKLEKELCVYVGDSVNKDITMAIDCGISDVWAEYGQAHHRPSAY
jgi:FMN phosphatase YigB (HAD superfamily)